MIAGGITITGSIISDKDIGNISGSNTGIISYKYIIGTKRGSA
jgi:hypothetical protein